MALVLVKEDGSGKADANSYASASDGDAYFDGHLYATAWTGAALGNKEKALVFATRLIDSMCQFNGARAHEAQALQWPRVRCPDPDDAGWHSWVTWNGWDRVVASDLVPTGIVKATCELARELLIADRTAAPSGEGILSERTSQYTRDSVGASTSTSNSKMYSKADTRPVLSRVVQAMLSKYGAVVNASAGSVRLQRV